MARRRDRLPYLVATLLVLVAIWLGMQVDRSAPIATRRAPAVRHPAPHHAEDTGSPAVVDAHAEADPLDAQAGPRPFRGVDRTLDNGLTVLLVPDHGAPTIAAHLVVKVGAVDDPPDALGSAHFLEHMLFKGSDRLGTADWPREKPHIDALRGLYDDLAQATDPDERTRIEDAIAVEHAAAGAYGLPNEFARLLDEIGAEWNAAMSLEYTDFLAEVPPNRLEVWARLEAERMIQPVFRGFTNERRVVPMRFSVTVITSLALAACAPTDGPSGGPTGSAYRAAPTLQQVVYWEAWREARTPSDHVRAQLSDSEGAKWDCVDIEHQPAFRRATLARARRAAEIVDADATNGQTISDDEIAAEVDAEFAASPLRDIDETEARDSLTAVFAEIDTAAKADGPASDNDAARQTDSRSVADISGSCPDGTVPIESWSTEQIALFGTLESFLSPEPPAGGPKVEHEYAMMADSGSFTGGKGFINIWDPSVELNSEFSLAQIWAWRGTGANTQTVEAGWQDYYGRTVSHKPRLFVFSTSDNYVTGCYNNNCGDWVQTSGTVSLNQTWSTFSTDGGGQYSDEYSYWRGPSTGDWYFVYNGTTVGYYPTELFDSAGLLNTASRFDIGGEIVNKEVGGDHTQTDMGSGQFPSAGWTHAAYARNVYSRTTTPAYIDFDVDGTGNEPGCYDITTGYSPGGWDVYAYFGGPGYHATNCP